MYLNLTKEALKYEKDIKKNKDGVIIGTQYLYILKKTVILISVRKIHVLKKNRR